MRVEVFMQSTFRERERDVLRHLYNGIKKDLAPVDLNPTIITAMKNFNKAKGLSNRVELSYDERGKGKYDLGVIFGSWKPNRKNLHHSVRCAVAENDKNFLCIETQLLGRKIFHESQYHRIGIDGFLNKAATFGLDKSYPNDRFVKLNLPYNGWKKKRGDKVVVALQLPGDASLREMDINEWAIWTITKLRKETDRPIEVRLHPGVSQKGVDAHLQLMQWHALTNLPNISFVKGDQLPWEEHILDAHCVVAFTSGLSIDAVLNGIPVIACDQGNFAWSISSNNVNQVENPLVANESVVQDWLNTLAYSQWSKEEMESGEAWAHLKPAVEQILQDEIESIKNESSELSKGDTGKKQKSGKT